MATNAELVMDEVDPEPIVLELIGSIAPVGAWCLDAETGRFAEIIRPTRPLTGWADELELLVRMPERLLDDASAAAWREVLQRTLCGGGGWDLLLGVLSPGGAHGWMRTLGGAETRGSRVVRVFGVVQDVTLVRAVERQLLQLQKVQALAEVAPVVAELRRLLSAISEYQQAAAEALPEWHPAQNDLAGLASALDHGSKLTCELLSLTVGGSPASAGLDLVALVGDMYPALRRVMGPAILVDVIHATRLSRVLADRRQLEQVILMIALRARSAMAQGGTLTLMTHDVVSTRPLPTLSGMRAPGAWVELALHDTGVPMAEETRARVFQPLMAADDVARESAVGMAAALRIVRQFDGLMDVESAPGEGTTVRLWLPATRGGPEPDLPQAS